MKIRLIYLPHRLAEVRFREGEKHSLIGGIQKRLAEQGLYQAEINNNYDANTAEAVSRFQDGSELKVTGNLDLITYCRLHQATAFTLETQKGTRINTAFARANIFISKSDRQLTLFDGNHPRKQFPVAIGKTSTPTPEGNFVIATKIPNPGGVLGTRWMGLNFGAYGIHGTNAPWAIGTMVSNGCIRMHNTHAEELFTFVSIGTPVFIRN